jgi:hypothetical protein
MDAQRAAVFGAEWPSQLLGKVGSGTQHGGLDRCGDDKSQSEIRQREPRLGGRGFRVRYVKEIAEGDNDKRCAREDQHP